MKVLLLNGSPHMRGTTSKALSFADDELKRCGIETETVWIGPGEIHGCIGCGKCRETGRCVFGDGVAEFTEKMKNADGLIVGTPVYYAAASGQLTCFLNRAFFSASASFRLKPAASVSVARRAGCTSAFDQLNKYFSIAEMPIVTSTYWNMVFGAVPSDAEKDEEGAATMRNLARNMAYLLRLKELGEKNGVKEPVPERKKTNFI